MQATKQRVTKTRATASRALLRARSTGEGTDRGLTVALSDESYYGFTSKAAYDAVQKDKAESPWIRCV